MCHINISFFAFFVNSFESFLCFKSTRINPFNTIFSYDCLIDDDTLHMDRIKYIFILSTNSNPSMVDLTLFNLLTMSSFNLLSSNKNKVELMILSSFVENSYDFPLLPLILWFLCFEYFFAVCIFNKNNYF